MILLINLVKNYWHNNDTENIVEMVADFVKNQRGEFVFLQC